jgi:hypothetical protein
MWADHHLARSVRALRERTMHSTERCLKRVVVAAAALVGLAATPAHAWTDSFVNGGIEGKIGEAIVADGRGTSLDTNRTYSAELVISCVKDKTQLYVQADRSAWVFFFRDFTGKYKLDKGSVKTTYLLASDDPKIFGKLGGDAVPFIKEVIGKNELQIQTHQVREPDQLLTFNVEGLETAIKVIADKCHWNPKP